MNRSERRKVAKKYGINNSFTKLFKQKKYDEIRQITIDNHKKHEEFKENVRIEANRKQDEIDNGKIASLATSLMVNDGLDYIDALEKAKEIYKEEKIQS
jgi:hypothetical protein